MAFALGRKAVAGGYRLVEFEEIGSTNSEAVTRAKLGEPPPLWVVAAAQTEGHGRRGRPWQTPRGNLAASLFVARPLRCSRPATLGFVAGLALYGAIGRLLPALNTRLRLKWPNDLLLDGAKVAGLLLEAVTVPGGTDGVVIGFGVNVRYPPVNVPYPTCSLADGGLAHEPEELFEVLSDEWVDCERLWSEGRGFPAIREAWLAHAAGVGLPVSVQWEAEKVCGTFETIGDDGSLILRRSDGMTRLVSAGDVHFGDAATAEPCPG
jgi:BirA family biotin operon repressor/biotin-[acetyl-CoA-carboxylase] ligase